MQHTCMRKVFDFKAFGWRDRDRASLWVLVQSSVYAKSLDRRWAKTQFPLTWQKEKLHNLTVLTYASSTRVGEKRTQLRYSTMEEYER